MSAGLSRLSLKVTVKLTAQFRKIGRVRMTRLRWTRTLQVKGTNSCTCKLPYPPVPYRTSPVPASPNSTRSYRSRPHLMTKQRFREGFQRKKPFAQRPNRPTYTSDIAGGSLAEAPNYGHSVYKSISVCERAFLSWR